MRCGLAALLIATILSCRTTSKIVPPSTQNISEEDKVHLLLGWDGPAVVVSLSLQEERVVFRASKDIANHAAGMWISPNGKWVAYMRRVDLPLLELPKAYRLFVRNVDTGEDIPLPTPPVPDPWFARYGFCLGYASLFSADSKSMLLTVGEDPTGEKMTVGIFDLEKRKLTSPQVEGNAFAPAFAAGGKEVYFSLTPKGGNWKDTELCLWTLADGTVQKVGVKGVVAQPRPSGFNVPFEDYTDGFTMCCVRDGFHRLQELPLNKDDETPSFFWSKHNSFFVYSGTNGRDRTWTRIWSSEYHEIVRVLPDLLPLGPSSVDNCVFLTKMSGESTAHPYNAGGSFILHNALTEKEVTFGKGLQAIRADGDWAVYEEDGNICIARIAITTADMGKWEEP